MSKLAVNTEEFNKFLSFSNLFGYIENTELTVSIDKGQLSVLAVSPPEDKVICYKGILKGDFEVLGQVGITGLSILRKFISSFPEETVTLKKTENKLSCEYKRTKYSTVLINPQYISNTLTEEKLKELKTRACGNEFTLKKEDVAKILSFKNSINPSEVILSYEKTLQIKLANQNHDVVIDIDAPKLETFTAKFSYMLIELLDLLKNYDLKISTKNQSPLYILLEDKNLKFEYLMAPLKK